MFKSDENNLGQTISKPSRMQGSENCRRKFGQEIRPNNRRVLSIINQNLNVATSNYPCVVNKRGFPENHHGICGKNKPITRNSSAALSCPEEEMSKRLKASDENFIYVDEEKASKDHTEPMFMEQAEDVAEKETLHHMEEVEMEDIFEEAILDIDGCDAKNPLAAVEYVDDIYAYYKRMESCSCVPSNYMAHQFDINERMRSILIDWLVEVQHKFELRDETLFLTVNLIDRFLSQQPVVRKKLQLVGLIAMLLACKYEEVSVPVVEDLIFISDKAYNRKEVLQMESLMLNTLQFNLSLPTQYVFMRRFLKASQSDKKLEHMAFFLTELCLVEYEMLRFSPSLLASAAIYTAHCTLYGFSQWNKTCEWHTNYNEDQLQECSRLIVGLHQRAGTGKLTGVYRKYITSKFGFTAKSEPALFLLAKTQQVL